MDEVIAAASAMSEDLQQHVYAPPADLAANAHVKSMEQYQAMYKESIENPEKFFGDMARDNFYWAGAIVAFFSSSTSAQLDHLLGYEVGNLT